MPPAETSFTVLLITESATGEPAADAEVSATARLSESFWYGEDDEGIELLAPLDASGRTYIPVVRFPDDPSALTVLVMGAGQTHTFRLVNIDGEIASDETFTVRVLSADAGPPPPPAMEPLIGSNPPQIRMDGYGSLLICDNESGNILWEIGSLTENYLATVTVGVVPDGFVEYTPVEPFACVWSTGEDPSGAMGYTVYSREPFSNEYYRGATYCLDDEGGVAPCP